MQKKTSDSLPKCCETTDFNHKNSGNDWFFTVLYWEYNVSTINRRGTKSQSSKIEKFLFEVFLQKGSKNIFDMTTHKKKENQLFL